MAFRKIEHALIRIGAVVWRGLNKVLFVSLNTF